MVGRWFFMIIGTIFSIMPAFVYWLAGTMAANGSPERPDRRRHRRVHDAPEPPVLPARAAAQRPGRDPGVARAVRPDLRVPRPRPRDHRRARRDRAAARDDAGRRGARGRLVPLPAGAVRGPADRRRRGGRRRSRVERRSSWARCWRPVRAEAFDGATGLEVVDGGRADEPAQPFGLDDISFEAKPGELVALVGTVGRRQDDDDLPHPPPVRRDRGSGDDRRRRRARRSSSSRSGA